ncbi:MAG: hypothetical protein ACI9DF_005747, partial [Verrucomicrobiales bacterium]
AVSPDESGLIVTGDAKGLAITDLNGDARPDFLISRNKDTMVAYENHTKAGKTVMVRLKGQPSNPSGIGARITLKTSDGASQTAEMLGGSGYLSQSTAALSFGLGQDAAPSSISVRWPNGTVKAYTSGFDRPNITLSP